MSTTMTRAARRTLTARTHAHRVRYQQIAARLDRKHATVTALPTRPALVETHVIRLVEDGEKHRAVCSCGELNTRPMGISAAKGQATRHRNALNPNAVSSATAEAAAA